jgi:hypothetical protein
MRSTLALGLAALALAGCGQSYAEKRAEALAAEPVITPGVYSNVRIYSAPAMDEGLEIELAEGSDSATVRAVNCEVACQPIHRLPVRRGLGGIAFVMPHGERAVDVSVQPDGSDAIMVSADWGNGLNQQRLVRVPRPFALDQSHSDTSETQAGSTPRP